MLSRGPGLGGDTSFIPNSHGRLGLALIGPSCVGKARIDLQTQLGGSVVRGGDGKSDRPQRSGDDDVFCVQLCLRSACDLAKKNPTLIGRSRARDGSATRLR